MRAIVRLAMKLAEERDNQMFDALGMAKDIRSDAKWVRSFGKYLLPAASAAHDSTYLDGAADYAGSNRSLIREHVGNRSIAAVNDAAKLPKPQAKSLLEGIEKIRSVDHNPFLKNYVGYAKGWRNSTLNGIGQTGLDAHLMGLADRVSNGKVTAGLSNVYTSAPVQKYYVKPVGNTVHAAGTVLSKMPLGPLVMNGVSVAGKYIGPAGYAADGAIGAKRAVDRFANNESIRYEDWGPLDYLSPTNLAGVAGDRIGTAAGKVYSLFDNTERNAAKPARLVNGKWQ